ncbi:MAG: hypothetical protein PHE48_03325 [Candidatus Daviesbacteria bacterium]|nr:hypothetical protein [Candidatus Daviesbacteria bacterium]
MNQSGQIFLLVLVALGVVLFTVLSIIAGAQLYYQNSSYSLDVEKATVIAEAGVDKAITSLNKTGGSYLGEAETALGDGSYSVTITSKDATTKIIQSTGYIPDKSKAKVKRSIKITASRGVGTAFVYGVQVGEGGLTLGNSNIITGTIYSNGSVSTVGGGNGNEITGDVWVAGGPQAIADRQTDCTGTNCTDFIFGTSVSGSSRLDVAQSFQPSVSNVLNKVSLKVKKIGNPSDVTVRIMADKSGQPDKNHILATGTLYSNLVSTNYPIDNWIDVTFDTLSNLTTGVTYWIMIDTSSNSSNYWAWQNDLAKSYTCGNPDLCFGMWSSDWSSGNPSWAAVSPGDDLSFKTFMGGAPTIVDGGVGKGILVKKDAQGNGGSVHANTIKNVDMQGDAYYQTIENSTAASLHPNSPDSPPKVFPISDANVLDWESQARDAGVTTGDITTCVNVLGPGKIVGNVTFDSHCAVTIKSPIWITGNLTFNTNNTLTLSSEYGLTSGVIVVGDGVSGGIVNLGSNNQLRGTGIGSSLLMILSNYDSRSDGVSAIVINNTGNSGVFYASKGIIEPGNRNTFKELTAWGIKLINNGILNYETGLSSTLFQSGPSGTYSLVKGTYQVK